MNADDDKQYNNSSAAHAASCVSKEAKSEEHLSSTALKNSVCMSCYSMCVVRSAIG